MKIETWPISRPIEYARNARKIPQNAIDAVAASLQEFGWQQPIVADGKDVILVGHTRLLAARKLGYDTVPVHVADKLTPAQAKAYRIMDNRSHDNSTWDPELLTLEFRELESEGFDLLLTGFSPEEMGNLFIGNEGSAEANGNGNGSGSGEPIPPDEFKSFDENIETEHVCPKCSYRWSGKPA